MSVVVREDGVKMVSKPVKCQVSATRLHWHALATGALAHPSPLQSQKA